jgi:hypothetical protein
MGTQRLRRLFHRGAHTRSVGAAASGARCFDCRKQRVAPASRVTFTRDAFIHVVIHFSIGGIMKEQQLKELILQSLEHEMGGAIV